MTNTGSLAGTRALHIEHVFAAIGALSQPAFRVAAHGAVDADPSRITRKTLDPRPPLTPRSRRRVRRRRGTSRRLTPQGAGVSRASAPTPSPGAPLTLRPGVIAQ